MQNYKKYKISIPNYAKPANNLAKTKLIAIKALPLNSSTDVILSLPKVLSVKTHPDPVESCHSCESRNP